MSATTYVPTKRNLAHAAAKTFREALADAVRAGVDADGQTAAEIAEDAGISADVLTQISSSTEIDLEDALHVARSLDDVGFAAFHGEVSDALGEVGPDGWDA